jgi:hypothetical protein
MIQPYVVAAAAAVLGGIIAISARDARVVVVGLLLAMCAAQLAASPEPANQAIAFRVLGSLLAAYLLWTSTRSRVIEAEGSGIGVVAECTVAAAAFAAGWFVAPVKPLAGPHVAQAAGIALIAISIVPLTGRDVLRVGAGATTLVLGGSMLLQAWAGQPSSLWHISLTALLVGLVGATSLLVSPIADEAATPGAIAEAALGADLEADLAPPDDETTVAAAAALVSAPPAARRGGRKAKVPAVETSAGSENTSTTEAEAGAAAAHQAPVPAVEAHTRVARIRDQARKSLRGGSPPAPQVGADGIEPPAAPPSNQPEQPVSSRVRRLRPREPRK